MQYLSHTYPIPHYAPLPSYLHGSIREYQYELSRRKSEHKLSDDAEKRLRRVEPSDKEKLLKADCKVC